MKNSKDNGQMAEYRQYKIEQSQLAAPMLTCEYARLTPCYIKHSKSAEPFLIKFGK